MGSIGTTVRDEVRPVGPGGGSDVEDRVGGRFKHTQTFRPAECGLAHHERKERGLMRVSVRDPGSLTVMLRQRLAVQSCEFSHITFAGSRLLVSFSSGPKNMDFRVWGKTAAARTRPLDQP